MERLAASQGESAPVSEETKAKLAELDETYRAKIAEREIFLQQKLVQAEASGEISEADAIRKQLANEKARLEEEREEKKQKLRDAG